METGNKLSSQRLGEFYFVSRQRVIKTLEQPEKGPVANHGGLPGTVLRNILQRSGGLRQRVHKEVRRRPEHPLIFVSLPRCSSARMLTWTIGRSVLRCNFRLYHRSQLRAQARPKRRDCLPPQCPDLQDGQHHLRQRPPYSSTVGWSPTHGCPRSSKPLCEPGRFTPLRFPRDAWQTVVEPICASRRARFLAVVAGVTSFGVLFYLSITIAGAAFVSCPYQTPDTNILHHFLHHILRWIPRTPAALHSRSSIFSASVKGSICCNSLITVWYVLKIGPHSQTNIIAVLFHVPREPPVDNGKIFGHRPTLELFVFCPVSCARHYNPLLHFYSQRYARPS